MNDKSIMKDDKPHKIAQVIMLPTKNELWKVNDEHADRFEFLFYDIKKKILYSRNSNALNWSISHLYIISDEEIKEGDWYENNGVIFKADDVFDEGNNPNNSNPRVTDWNKKIILTTDLELQKDGIQAIDDEFLEWFCNNSSCERVEIRYTVDFNSKAVIIIPKEEPKYISIIEKMKPLQEKWQKDMDESLKPKQETLEVKRNYKR